MVKPRECLYLSQRCNFVGLRCRRRGNLEGLFDFPLSSTVWTHSASMVRTPPPVTASVIQTDRACKLYPLAPCSQLAEPVPRTCLLFIPFICFCLVGLFSFPGDAGQRWVK